jgi:Zn-dependent peptidase ImmA (M78 family)/transcriptional regulator with XRE-family HTH domain
MARSTLKNLKEVRERFLGYRRESVARLTGIAVDRLVEIEADFGTPSVFELEQLSRVYGIDYEFLLERPVRLGPGDIVQTLASLEEFHEIGDIQRFRIIEASNAAKDLHVLEGLLGVAPRAEVSPIAYDKGAPPYRQGADAAARIRERFSLPDGPVPSIRDFVKDLMPGVRLFHSELGSDGPAAVTLADAQIGPTIILNLEGKNRNPAVRRFSLAHELAHLLMDRRRGKPLAILSGYYTESALAIEQRANAFAVRLLCPPHELESLPDDGLEAAKCLIRKYGMHYSAARLYLKNERRVTLPERIPEGLVTSCIDHGWEVAEEPHGLSGFPIKRVPPERRTYVAAAAAQAYSRRLISRGRFAELLRVPPTEEVEQVLDFFVLALPQEVGDVA